MKEVFVVSIVFGMISWVTWVIASSIRKGHSARAVADLHSKLLDKCGSSQELVAYLESKAGQRFLESTATVPTDPPTRILNAIQAGFILALAGGAMLLVRMEIGDLDTRLSLVVSGSVSLAVGLGFLLSAAVSYILCQSWGLMRSQPTNR
jgi:hypothetical protein